MGDLGSVVELLVGLLAALALLVLLARRLSLPYPILLVVGGLALGFLPGVPRVELAPNLVFLLFLPLLYEEAYFTSWRDFRANLRPISILVFGLVLATTCAVAAVAHWAVPGLSWATAFVLGTVVAPTDEIAVVPVVHRLQVPRRVVTVIEGESLVNDAVSLVIYGGRLAQPGTAARSASGRQPGGRRKAPSRSCSRGRISWGGSTRRASRSRPPLEPFGRRTRT